MMASMKAIKAKKITIGKIIFLAILVLGLIPIVGITFLEISESQTCSTRMSKLTGKAEQISSAVDDFSYPTSQKSVEPNGDCTTGSGVEYGFMVNQQYLSPQDAKDDILKNLAETNITTISLDQPPTYMEEGYGNVSGGDTPIQYIRLVYQYSSGNVLTLEFDLDQPVPCSTDGKVVTCAGEEKSMFINNILSTKSISTVKVSGLVHV